MKSLLVTAVIELGWEVISAVRQRRKRRLALEQRQKLQKARELARIKAYTAKRIREAKEKYWRDRRERDAAKVEKEQLDANPYE